MKILSPIDKAEEAAPLAEAGADELYGGYVSRRWAKKFSLMGSPNHRYFPNAQVSALSDLKKIIRGARAGGARFFLAMNAPYYSQGQYALLLDDADDALSAGADAIIAADLGLILRLRERFPKLEVHLSTLGAVFNSMTPKFFRKLDVSRFVLPRELTVSESAEIIGNNPGSSFDAFIFIGKCPNVESFCGFTHNNPNLVWPCEEEYEIRAVRGDDRAKEIIEAQSGWSRINRRQACGLCAVKGLLDAGVYSLKIVGRGGPMAMKVGSVRAVKDALALILSGASEKELAEFSRKKYRETFGADCNPYVCYFPSDCNWARSISAAPNFIRS